MRRKSRKKISKCFLNLTFDKTGSLCYFLFADGIKFHRYAIKLSRVWKKKRNIVSENLKELMSKHNIQNLHFVKFPFIFNSFVYVFYWIE